MSIKKPGIVIVPGGMHVPAHYTRLGGCLTEAGYSVLICDMPSNGGPEPVLGIAQDVETIQKTVRSFLGQDTDVLLVMHSVAGIWGTEASQGFRPQDQPNGKGIISLVYIAGFPPDKGVSAINANGGEFSRGTTVMGVPGPNARVFMRASSPTHDAREIFYNDCTPEDADDAMSKVVMMSVSGCYHECIYPAWKEIESNYLICELDQAIPVEGQEVLAAQEGGKWKNVERIRAGHSPFLSKPQETALFIRKCAGENV